MSTLAVRGPSFVREHLRTRLTLVLLVAIPVFFVLIFASVLGQFATALGGRLGGQAATAISAGWAAAFLSGALAFFEVGSSRAADRRLALAGLGAGRVALARITAALSLAVMVSAVAFLTLSLRSGIEHPFHAALAILGFATIYIGIGALVGAFVSGALEGSLLVILVFMVDVFSSPAMTSGGGLLGSLTPTRKAADLLIAAGSGQPSPAGDWIAVATIALGALGVALAAFARGCEARKTRKTWSSIATRSRGRQARGRTPCTAETSIDRISIARLVGGFVCGGANGVGMANRIRGGSEGVVVRHAVGRSSLSGGGCCCSCRPGFSASPRSSPGIGNHETINTLYARAAPMMISMAELALNDVQRHALKGHLGGAAGLRFGSQANRLPWHAAIRGRRRVIGLKASIELLMAPSQSRARSFAP